MGILLFLLVASSYDILKYFHFHKTIKKNIFNRLLYHLFDSILLFYAFYLIEEKDFSIIGSLFFIIIIAIPASEYRMSYDE